MKKVKKTLIVSILTMVALLHPKELVRASVKNVIPLRWRGMQTTGDAAILTVRAEFQDVKFDDGCYTEEQLRAMFDGIDTASFSNADLDMYESLSGYYERSSYGKLHINCGDQIYSCTLSHDRSYYSEAGGDELVKEVLNQLDDEIDYEDYDLDQDGYLDGICINFAGPDEGRDSLWWSHAAWYQNIPKTETDDPESEAADSWDGIKAANYMFLHTSLLDDSGKVNTDDAWGHRVLIHETGHMLGLADYYNEENEDNGILTEDMMCDNKGDHNGFSKWLLGWLKEDQVLWLTKDSVEEDGQTVELTALSSEDSSEEEPLIAVIAPEKASDSNGIYAEYFVVEYDEVDVGNYDGTTSGFRVFHVDARLEEDGKDFLNKNENGFGNRMIYAVAKVDGELRDEYYVSGDCLTPYTKEATNFYGGSIRGFTGITLTDFQTGTDTQNPSFHVSFAERGEVNGIIAFKPDRRTIGNWGDLVLTGDKPLTQNFDLTESAYYMDDSGNTYPVSVLVSPYDACEIEVIYQDYQEKPLKPDTSYTLIIPAGMFQIDEDVYSEEYRITIKTGKFPEILKNHVYPYEEDILAYSSLFSVGSDHAGMFCINQKDGDGMEAVLHTYSGKGDSSVSQILTYPDGSTDIFIESAEGWQTENGTFVLGINGFMDRKQVSLLYHITDFGKETPVKPYVIEDYAALLPAEHGARAISKTMNPDEILFVYKIDFEEEPDTVTVQDEIYFPTEELAIYPIDRNTYAIVNPNYCVNVYDEENHLLYTLSHNNSEIRTIYGVTPKGSAVILFHSVMTESEDGMFVEDSDRMSLFDETGKLIETKKIPADFKLSRIEKVTPVSFGYHIVFQQLESPVVHYFVNEDFDILSSMEISSYDGCIRGNQFLFKDNTENGLIISVTKPIAAVKDNGTGSGGSGGSGSGNDSGDSGVSGDSGSGNGRDDSGDTGNSEEAVVSAADLGEHVQKDAESNEGTAVFVPDTGNQIPESAGSTEKSEVSVPDHSESEAESVENTDEAADLESAVSLSEQEKEPQNGETDDETPLKEEEESKTGTTVYLITGLLLCLVGVVLLLKKRFVRKN